MAKKYITHEQAFVKYFGTVKEIFSQPLPVHCKECDWVGLSIEVCIEHVNATHEPCRSVEWIKSYLNRHGSNEDFNDFIKAIEGQN